MKDTSRRRHTSVLITCGTLLLALWVAYVFRVVVGPLLLAAALAYILEPLVQWLVRRGWKRPFAVTTILLAGLLFGLSMLGALAAGAVQFVSEFEVGAVAEVEPAPPEGVDAEPEGGGESAGGGQDEGRVFKGVEAFFAKAKDVAQDAPPWVRDSLQKLASPATWEEPAKLLLQFAQKGLSGLFNALSLLGVLLLLPVYLFYVMLELDKIWNWVRAHLPEYDREHTLRVCSRLDLPFCVCIRCGHNLNCLS